MDLDFSKTVVKFFLEGYSCSESFARAAVEVGIADDSFVSIATSFSAGMSSKCLCGALAGSQMIIGLLHGKNNDNTARELSKKMYEKFTSKFKVSCCKVLSSGFKDFHSPERRAHCAVMVEQTAKMLIELLNEAELKESQKI